MKISKLIIEKKGELGGLGTLPKVAILFVVVGIVFGIGFTIVSQQQDTYASCPTVGATTYTYNSAWKLCQNGTSGNASVIKGYAWNATEAAQAGSASITAYLPTIGLVVAAIIVIGLVVGLLYKNG